MQEMGPAGRVMLLPWALSPPRPGCLYLLPSSALTLCLVTQA